MRVIVITPLYKSVKNLNSYILSIQNNLIDNLKIVLIDDCCPEKSGERFEIAINKLKLPSYLIKNNRNIGPGLSRYNALKMTNADFYCFLDADDYWSRGKIIKQINYMISNQISWTYTKFFSGENLIPKNNLNLHLLFEINKRVKNPKDIISRRFIHPSSIVFIGKIDKEIFDTEELRVCEDILYEYRLYYKYGLPHIVNDCYSIHNLNSLSISINKFDQVLNFYKLLFNKKFFDFHLIKKLYYFINYLFYGYVTYINKKFFIYKNIIFNHSEKQ